ncbi:hypothetical protein EFB08_18815 [Rufibacter latericius]|uniref:DUF4190 domain-containing protein n=1 Tax=Rufibacter latericius TaxID=2487040 RepID=A0A3M9MFE1_9BACT|nr:hypothetical protein EFB08_18815 [Rufibacter latericius]
MFLLSLLLFVSGCAKKEFFRFSAPVVRSHAQVEPDNPASTQIMKLPSSQVPQETDFSEANHSPVVASAEEPAPVLVKPVYEQTGSSPSGELSKEQGSQVIAPLQKQRNAVELFPGKAEPKTPGKGTARAGLLLGILSFVLAVAGLSSLTRGGAALLLVSFLTSLAGAVFSGKALSWNRKHPEDPVNAKGATTGLWLSLAAAGLLAFFAILVIVLL